MRNEPKRLVVLGTDHNHCRMIVDVARRRPGIQVTAVAQEEPPGGRKPPTIPGARSYASYEECLDREEPHIVGVTMHHGARARWIIEALRRGMAVVADKPLCMTSRELGKIREAHARSQASLALMLTERCNESYVAIRKAVTKGAIGEVVAVEAMRYYALNRSTRPSWMFDRQTYAGPVLDLLIHDYDLARWITGLEWTDAMSREERSGRYEDRDFKDVAILSAIERGRALSCAALWHSPDQHRSRFTVYGTHGHVDLGLGRSAPVLTDKKGRCCELPLWRESSFMDQAFFALLDGRAASPITSEEALSVTECLIRSLERGLDFNGRDRLLREMRRKSVRQEGGVNRHARIIG